MSFITGKHLPRRTFLRGMGATVALPFLDAMAPAGRFGRAVAAATADVTRLVCIEEVHGLPGCNEWGASRNLFAPATVGGDFELLPDNALEVARAVPRLPDHRQQHRRAHGRGVQPAGDRRRPLPVVRGLPDPVSSQADPGLGPVRRDVARPALRAAVRPGDADAVDAVVHREPRPGGRLHLQLLVRLHRLDKLVVAERAAADDPRPAGGVRDAVRGRRHPRGAGRAPGHAAQHPRLDPQRRGRGPQGAGHGGPAADGPLPRRRPRGRAPHPDGRGAQRRRRDADAARRPARRARLVHRAHAAPVRSAGARAGDRHDAGDLVQDRPRRPEPRLPRERLQPAVPPRLAPRQQRRADHGVQHGSASTAWASSRTSSSG